MTDAPAKRRRRWLSFSLRTMFVVATVLGLSFWSEISIIHQRQQIQRSIVAQGGEVWTDEFFFDTFTVGGSLHMQHAREAKIALIKDGCRVSSWRKMLGDHEVFRIVMPANSTESDRGHIALYFPGTEVRVFKPNVLPPVD